MMRWRTYTDRLIVLAVILAAWQVGSFLVGPYWLSSPGAVAARFCAQIWNGELIRHGGYTVEEALIGTLVGGVPAVLLPFLLRRHPVMVAILDPFMVGGWRPQARLRAAVHPLVRHRHRIQDRAGGGCRLLHRLFQRAIRRARARSPARPDGTDRRRRRAARGAARGSAAAVPHILAGFRIAVPYAIGGAIIAELISSNRGLGYLVQTGAMNFDTTSVFSAILAATLIVHAANWLLNAAERTLLRWRPPAQAMLDAEN